ncbi:MAG: EAL domain-containing protein [Bacillus sp. (in: firmicutes)]
MCDVFSERKRNNTVKFYTSDLSENTTRTRKIESVLRHAVEEEEFVLYYQPQVDLKSKEIIGVEALIRWEHPIFGIIPISFANLL